MKVIQLITRSDTIGGSQRHVLDLAMALKHGGDEVIVVSGPQGPFTDLLRSHGIEVRSIASLLGNPSVSKIWYDIRAARELTSLIRSESVDLIACHSSKAGLIGRLVACHLKLPCVYTLHGLSFNPGVNLVRRAFAWAIEMVARPFSDQLIAVSEYDGELAIRSKIISKSKLHVIPNSVHDGGLVHMNFRGITNIVMPARLDNQKDHRLLFRALAQLDSDKWFLELLGNGPLEQELKNYVDELGLSSQVNFSGLVPDIRPYLEQANFVALTSRYEGLPLAILEALSCGLPVVASDVGGVGEAVIDGINGYLVPPDDLDTLVLALKKLIGDKEQVQKMGEASRIHYEENYSFEEFVTSTIEIYRGLLKK